MLWRTARPVVFVGLIPVQVAAWAQAPTVGSRVAPMAKGVPSMVKGSTDGWEDAVALGTFSPWLPSTEGVVAAKTVAKILWTKDAFYIMVEALDPNPEKIRSFPTLRDKLITLGVPPPQYNQDTITVDIDPSGRGASAITLVCNPDGSQLDGTTRYNYALDTSFDLDWEASCSRMPYGYLVKIKVPLTSLQGVKESWKIRVSRSYPRENNYVFVWPQQPLNSSCFLCVMGDIPAPPQNKTSSPFFIIPSIPYSTTTTTDPATGAKTKTSESKPGLDVRYSTNSRSFEGTYRPDFSAVEADIDPLAVNTRYKVSYPEKRPFFMNGMTTMAPTGCQTQFYSRSIIQPEWAVKGNGNESWGSWFALAGKDQYGGTAFGDQYGINPTADAAVGSLINTVGDGSDVTIKGTSRTLMGSDPLKNQTSGISVDQGLGPFFISLDRIDSYTKNHTTENVHGFADNASVTYTGKTYWINVQQGRTSPDADFAMGLVDMPGYIARRATYNYTYANPDKHGFVSKLTLWASGSNYTMWDKTHLSNDFAIACNANMRGGFWTQLYVAPVGKETYANQQFDITNGYLYLKYTGINGLLFSAKRAIGNTTDYYTSTQCREVKDTFAAEWSYSYFVTSLNYYQDTLRNKETNDLNLRAHRLYGNVMAKLPYDFYARVTVQSVDINRPTMATAPKSTSVLQQYLFGWTPNVFTNIYVGYSNQKGENYTRPFAIVNERLFAKASYAIRF